MASDLSAGPHGRLIKPDNISEPVCVTFPLRRTHRPPYDGQLNPWYRSPIRILQTWEQGCLTSQHSAMANVTKDLKHTAWTKWHILSLKHPLFYRQVDGISLSFIVEIGPLYGRSSTRYSSRSRLFIKHGQLALWAMLCTLLQRVHVPGVS